MIRLCISPSVPKYDPPVTLEAPLPEETPGVLSDPGDISTGKYRSKANRRGTQMFRTNNDIGSFDYRPYPRPNPLPNPRPKPRRYTPGPNGELPGDKKPTVTPTVVLAASGGQVRPNRKGIASLETNSTASTKKKNVSANPGLTINR